MRVERYVARFRGRTSTWANGTSGPVFACVPDGKLPEDTKRTYNAKYPGEFYVTTSGSSSHFMTADTTIEMLSELYGPAFEAQRRTYGLELADPG